MKIAVIGSGISGFISSYYLQDEHEITIYEANDYVGGHTATVDVTVKDKSYAIDTGFIVFNDKTYPNFNKFLNDIGATWQNTDMSFSVYNKKCDIEYNGNSLNTLFSQRKNLISPKYYKFLYEIVRFNKLCKDLNTQKTIPTVPLADFLKEHRFSDFFQNNYILPMIAAIWSSSYQDALNFPLPFFIKFFDNHGLLNIQDRPQWHVIEGGSREYINKLLPKLKAQILLEEPVQKVQRDNDQVTIVSKNQTQTYDKVIFACHSDQALRLLDKPTEQEQSILSQIKYIPNSVILHTDTSRLPRYKRSWACWNYMIETDMKDTELASVSYNMNILQGIKSETDFIVSLNQESLIDPSKILRKFEYHHPLFSLESDQAKKQKNNICGHNNSYYCGAYWHSGFHEDGVVSALKVVKKIKG